MAAAVQAIEGPPKKKGPSIIIQAAMLLVMTGAALGAGWFVGGYLRSEVPAPAVADAPPQEAGPDSSGHGAPAGGHGEAVGGHGDAAAGHGEEPKDGEPAGPTQTLFDLPSMTTNLAAPADVWARMEVSIQFDEPPASGEVVESVHQDLLAFLRTVKFHQIEGASGIQHLRADLQERASIRTDGHVKHVYIRTLLFE